MENYNKNKIKDKDNLIFFNLKWVVSKQPAWTH